MQDAKGAHPEGLGGKPRSFADYAAEHNVVSPPVQGAVINGADVSKMTIEDALVRTQQIMAKVALNPSNVLGYDTIHKIDPETGVYFFEGDFGDFLNEAARFYLLNAYGIRIAAFSTGQGLYNDMKRKIRAGNDPRINPNVMEMKILE